MMYIGYRAHFVLDRLALAKAYYWLLAGAYVPYVGDVVELRHDAVPVVGPREAVLLVDLGAEVAEDDDGGRVWAEQDGAHEELEVVERRAVARAAFLVSQKHGADGVTDGSLRSVVGVELDDDEVGVVWQVVGVAKGEILRVGAPHGAVGELGGRVGEDAVPPVEETGWIAVRCDGVVAGAVTCRY